MKAVQEPVGVRNYSLVLLTMWMEREQSMAWVAEAFNDFPGLPFTPSDIEVLCGRELGPSDVPAVRTTLCIVM